MVLDIILNPFFPMNDPNKGAGLGLSTVMAVIKSHGGFINVDSELDKGAAFHAYFPALGDGFTVGEEPAADLRSDQGKRHAALDDARARTDFMLSRLNATSRRASTRKLVPSWVNET